MSQGSHLDARLEHRAVGKIRGNFFVAHYQRGYRWGVEEVTRLLEDIEESQGDPYSLQPVVVKAKGGEWELVDGQQRLTTLFLIYQYLHREGWKNIGPAYSIRYETRPQSEDYLEDPVAERSMENIDFFHIHRAYRCIADWFEKHDRHDRQAKADQIYGYLHQSVRVIWYEAPPDADATTIFTRLNVGRIPLTDAELVKALVLATARGTEKQPDRAQEVAAQWDGIERDLRQPELWAFVTSRSPEDTPTRISLLLDAQADLVKRPKAKRRPLYYTFDTLRSQIEQESWKPVWNQIVQLHSHVLGWYADRETFHKIGYLESVTKSPFVELLEMAGSVTKSELRDALDQRIRDTLGMTPEEVLGLSYDRDADKAKLQRLLLLMNLETVCATEHSHERYSFQQHRAGKWSLEHIHAQNAQQLTTVEQWETWVDMHREALTHIPVANESEREALLARIDATRSNLTRHSFRKLAAEVEAVFRAGAEASGSPIGDLHSIANLALLGGGDNAALGNAVFEVKRRRILEMDARGAYIPVCTRRVFLKYYTPERQQPHFWDATDREAYVQAMLGPGTGLLVKHLEPAQVAAS